MLLLLTESRRKHCEEKNIHHLRVQWNPLTVMYGNTVLELLLVKFHLEEERDGNLQT